MLRKVLSWILDEGLNKQLFYKLNNISYPSEDLILNIHKILVKHFADGKHKIHEGILSPGNLSHLLYHIQYYYYQNSKKSEKVINEKAAYMMHYLFTSHTFVDGNKRTGFVVTMLFLSVNMFPEPKRIVDYVRNVEIFKEMADGKTNNIKEIKKVLKWIEENT